MTKPRSNFVERQSIQSSIAWFIGVPPGPSTNTSLSPSRPTSLPCRFTGMASRSSLEKCTPTNGSSSSSDLLHNTPSPNFFFFFNDTASTEIYTLSLHDALSDQRSVAHPQVR